MKLNPEHKYLSDWALQSSTWIVKNVIVYYYFMRRKFSFNLKYQKENIHWLRECDPHHTHLLADGKRDVFNDDSFFDGILHFRSNIPKNK